MDKNYKYLRIQGREIMANTLTGRGIFSMCTELIRNHVMDKEDQELFDEVNSWFAENLPWPEACLKQEPVVCYFKTENSNEMLKWIKPMLWLLDRYGVPYYLVYTNTPGEIVYEDQYQIVARVDDIVLAPIPEGWHE